MSIAKVSEIIASSTVSFDDALKKGVQRATQTLENVVGIWIKDQQVHVRDGKITEYRLNLKVTFILK